MIAFISTYLKRFFESKRIYIVALGCIYIVCWLTNGQGLSKFDMPELRQFIVCIYGVFVAEHGVNSKFNSEDGKYPNSK